MAPMRPAPISPILIRSQLPSMADIGSSPYGNEGAICNRLRMIGATGEPVNPLSAHDHRPEEAIPWAAPDA